MAEKCKDLILVHRQAKIGDSPFSIWVHFIEARNDEGLVMVFLLFESEFNILKSILGLANAAG